jgi:dTDP-4-amino-4,6-dideoxygalactose transaminase
MTTLTSERHKGRSASYDVQEIGLNYRFDEIRAAIGLVQLDKLLESNAKREELTKHYHDQLSDIELDIPFSTTLYEMSPAFHIYPILLPKGQDRRSVITHLKNDGIQASIHYPSFASFTAYAHLVSEGDLPIVDEISVRELTLPLHPRMSKADVETVCNSLKKVIN